jgi:hypothetical protein
MREPTRLPAGEECKLQLLVPIDGPTHHYQGWARLAVYESGIYLQWEGEAGWYAVSWWELAHFAHATPPKLREELKWVRDDAYTQGLEDAVKDAKAHPELWRTRKGPQKAL